MHNHQLQVCVDIPQSIRPDLLSFSTEAHGLIEYVFTVYIISVDLPRLDCFATNTHTPAIEGAVVLILFELGKYTGNLHEFPFYGHVLV